MGLRVFVSRGPHCSSQYLPVASSISQQLPAAPVLWMELQLHMVPVTSWAGGHIPSATGCAAGPGAKGAPSISWTAPMTPKSHGDFSTHTGDLIEHPSLATLIQGITCFAAIGDESTCDVSVPVTPGSCGTQTGWPKITSGGWNITFPPANCFQKSGRVSQWPTLSPTTPNLKLALICATKSNVFPVFFPSR